MSENAIQKCPNCKTSNYIRTDPNGSTFCSNCLTHIHSAKNYGDEFQYINFYNAQKKQTIRQRATHENKTEKIDDEYKLARLAKHMEENWMVYILIFQKN